MISVFKNLTISNDTSFYSNLSIKQKIRKWGELFILTSVLSTLASHAIWFNNTHKSVATKIEKNITGIFEPFENNDRLKNLTDLKTKHDVTDNKTFFWGDTSYPKKILLDRRYYEPLSIYSRFVGMTI